MAEEKKAGIEDTPYRNTGETYGEYIKRLEDIIYNWHDHHTTFSFKVKENKRQLEALQQTYLKALENCAPQSTESHFLMGRCAAMADAMKILKNI